VLSVLVYEGIRRGLAPLERLEAQLANRNMASLSPIEMTQAPEEVHSLANTLNQLLTTLRRSLSQEKRFLNDAAHQLRTPLAGLISQTELAMQEKDPEALQQRLTKVHTGAQRSAHLVHQLLSLARTEAEVSLVPVDAASLAREVAREWTRRALAAGVDLGYEGEDTVMVPADKLLLREVLSNLIDNALRYAGKGAVVTLRTTVHDGFCWLDVEDTGPGVSGEQLERVFERFWRASELPGGCGLGLSIVARRKVLARRLRNQKLLDSRRAVSRPRRWCCTRQHQRLSGQARIPNHQVSFVKSLKSGINHKLLVQLKMILRRIEIELLLTAYSRHRKAGLPHKGSPAFSLRS
jgi:two-component system sensor histidine kinase TctE